MSADDLLSFIESMPGDDHLAIEENLGDGFVRLKTAEAERRQAKHDIRCVEDIVIEMLRNSRDAHARNIFLATSRDGVMKTLVFIDDGDGIPAEMQERIFEPRVTSKLETMVMDNWGVHGRGMALYSIKSNVEHIEVLASTPSMGSDIVVHVDLDLLAEKTDQSSLPVLAKDEEGHIVVSSGPHNVNRTVAEFALDMKDKVNVYLGTPAEIAATLIEVGKGKLRDAQLLFCEDLSKIPITLRPAAASDASELAAVCNDLGLDMSARTAHRIYSGDIKPVEPLLEKLMQAFKPAHASERSLDIYQDRRGLRVSAQDLKDFSRALESAFAELADKYYIELDDEPIIRVGKDAITVKFPFEKEL